MERISQSMFYNNIINALNRSTTRLQELREQGSTQKKVNQPSDDPVGYGRILNYRDSINAIKQFENNINTSKGWLAQSDDTMQQVQDVMTRVKELTTQAANETLNKENRESIYKEVRQLFDQMINLSNTEYQGKSIFAGHKVEGKAYEQGVAVYSNKESGFENYHDDVTPYVKDVQGNVSDPVSIRFSDASGSGRDKAKIGEDDNIRFSVFQGDVQTSSGILGSGDTQIDLGDVKVDLKEGYEVELNSSGGAEQTELYLAPTAYYQGDTRNKPGVEIKNNKGINVDPLEGSFDSNVRVQIENNPDLGDGTTDIEYKYSLDGGTNWTDTVKADNSSTEPTLDLPGGKVQLSNAGSNNLSGLSFDINGTRVVQSKQDVNMTTSDDFADSEDVMVRIDNNEVELGSGIDIEYSYSTDNGSSWHTGNTSSNTSTEPDIDITHDFDGDGTDETNTVTLRSQGDINTVQQNAKFKVQDESTGGDNVSRVPNVHSVAQGNFDQNVQVRIDDRDPNTDVAESTELGTNQTIRYSYSTDGGETWNTGNEIDQEASSDYQDLVVPGGILKLAPTEETGATSKLNVGDQFKIQPRNAEQGLEVSQGSEVDINNMGPEVFGGHYKNESGIEPAFEEDQQNNLFLGLGKLMLSLKHNDQENINKSLGYVDSAIQQVSERQADVGARINRVEASENMLSELKTNQKERKSEIEDVDFAKLMSQLNKQNTVYQTILKSSSMVMRQSLVDYV